MKRAVITVACLVLAGGVGLGLAFGQNDPREQPAEGPELKKLMQKKLKHAQGVLGGLAVEDFQQINQNASALLDLTHQAEWKVTEHPDYLRYSSEFRRTLQSLMSAAGRENIDGATLAYMQMTMSCVACHQFIRDREGAEGLTE